MDGSHQAFDPFMSIFEGPPLTPEEERRAFSQMIASLGVTPADLDATAAAMFPPGQSQPKRRRATDGQPPAKRIKSAINQQLNDTRHALDGSSMQTGPHAVASIPAPVSASAVLTATLMPAATSTSVSASAILSATSASAANALFGWDHNDQYRAPAVENVGVNNLSYLYERYLCDVDRNHNDAVAIPFLRYVDTIDKEMARSTEKKRPKHFCCPICALYPGRKRVCRASDKISELVEHMCQATKRATTLPTTTPDLEKRASSGLHAFGVQFFWQVRVKAARLSTKNNLYVCRFGDCHATMNIEGHLTPGKHLAEHLFNSPLINPPPPAILTAGNDACINIQTLVAQQLDSHFWSVFRTCDTTWKTTEFKTSPLSVQAGVNSSKYDTELWVDYIQDMDGQINKLLPLDLQHLIAYNRVVDHTALDRLLQPQPAPIMQPADILAGVMLPPGQTTATDVVVQEQQLDMGGLNHFMEQFFRDVQGQQEISPAEADAILSALGMPDENSTAAAPATAAPATAAPATTAPATTAPATEEFTTELPTLEQRAVISRPPTSVF